MRCAKRLSWLGLSVQARRAGWWESRFVARRCDGSVRRCSATRCDTVSSRRRRACARCVVGSVRVRSQSCPGGYRSLRCSTLVCVSPAGQEITLLQLSTCGGATISPARHLEPEREEREVHEVERDQAHEHFLAPDLPPHPVAVLGIRRLTQANEQVQAKRQYEQHHDGTWIAASAHTNPFCRRNAADRRQRRLPRSGNDISRAAFPAVASNESTPAKAGHRTRCPRHRWCIIRLRGEPRSASSSGCDATFQLRAQSVVRAGWVAHTSEPGRLRPGCPAAAP